MIMLLFLSLLSIGAIIVVSKKVSNKFLRYLLISIFLAIAIGAIWMIVLALKSGEM